MFVNGPRLMIDEDEANCGVRGTCCELRGIAVRLR
jgi:hypothetical protein